MGRFRLISWCAWILCALLVVASVDATPDPPAVAPHMATAKILAPSECAKSLSDASGNRSSFTLLALFPTQVSVFIGDTDPDGPATIMAETGQAADPSPPAVV